MPISNEGVGRKPSPWRASARRDMVSAFVLAAPVLLFVGLAACNLSKLGGNRQLAPVGAMSDSAAAVGGATTTINTAFAFTAPY